MAARAPIVFDPDACFPSVKIIGVGTGSLGALRLLRDLRTERVQVIAVDGDRRALDKSGVYRLLHLDPPARGGRVFGRPFKAAQESDANDPDRLRGLIIGADLVVIVACLGGRFGSSIAPMAAAISQQTGALTIAIVTFPFESEPVRTRRAAIQALEQIEEQADSTILVPMSPDPGSNPSNTRASADVERFDQVVAQGVRGLIHPIVHTNLLNTDFGDLTAVFRAGGRGSVSTGLGAGEDGADRAVQSALGDGALLSPGQDLRDARELWTLIEGDDSLTLTEVNQVATSINRAIGENLTVQWSVVIDNSLKGQIRVTVITSGEKHTHGLARSASGSQSSDRL
jgi:cell division protein FtsZ